MCVTERHDMTLAVKGTLTHTTTNHLSYIMKRHNHELRFAKIFDSLTESFKLESCKGDSKKSNNENNFPFHVMHVDLHMN